MAYVPGYLARHQANALLDTLIAELPWAQHTITLFGKTHQQPRLICWMGDASYRYSGRTYAPTTWHPAVAALRDRVAEHCGAAFNSVLINLYRDGNDSMGWHADDEPELGAQPVIASVSLGAPRDFRMRRKDRSAPPASLALEHGSMLCMRGDTQLNWQHSLPRRVRETAPRINLTFRKIAAQAANNVA